ncbi:MAG: nucleotidyltransferase domain-containing protein [Thermomicrobiales bacterium]|nr:nucleotidyltransferase domain-containing protein [Thermomicrobiales bacterium]
MSQTTCHPAICDSSNKLPVQEAAIDKQLAQDRPEDVLAEIVRRIVEVAAPERIILFGSAARAEAGPESDLDLLVIKPGRYHRGRMTEEIYLRLVGIGRAVDVVVVTSEDVDRYQDAPGLVIAPALREGRVVYAA